MSSADTIVKRALNICGAHSETLNPATPELLEIGRQQLVSLLRLLAKDEVYIGGELESLTSVGLVATATKTGHGFVTPDVVLISGASVAAYNRRTAITGDTANTFTYALLEAADTPAVEANEGLGLRALVLPDEIGDEIGEDDAATVDLYYLLAVQLEPVSRKSIKPEHRARCDAARGNLERLFQVPTIPRAIPSRMLPRGQGSQRGPQAPAHFGGEALDDDSAS